MTRVKICGMQSPTDVMLADKYGADAVGILVGKLHDSGDFVPVEVANLIVQAARPFLTPVLVTHLEDEAQIMSLALAVPCAVIQLHSDLPSRTLASLRRSLRPMKIIGKISVQDDSALDRAKELAGCVDAIVLDSIDKSRDRVGGTGLVHDWSISAKIVAASAIPVILAGGLTPANVKKAIAQVKPWAVDVNSGVKGAGGVKEESLVKAFIAASRSG
jgi:phosphoribosylanthranilate isomerase